MATVDVINWLSVIVLVMVVLSVLLFVFAPGTSQGWLAVFKTASWTVSVILIWYLVISPLFTKFILWILQKKKNSYGDRVSGTLSFIPVLRRLTVIAWQKSNTYKGWGRWYFFFSTLLHWSLIYTDHTMVSTSVKDHA